MFAPPTSHSRRSRQPRRLSAATALIAASRQLTTPLTLGCQHNGTSVRAPRKRRSVARCIPRSVTALRPQLKSNGTRRVGLAALHRPATFQIPTRGQVLSRQPAGTACSLLSITKWSRIKRQCNATQNAPRIEPFDGALAVCLDAETRADVNCRLPLAFLMASSSRSERRRSRYLPLKSRSSNRTGHHPRGGGLVDVIRRDDICDLPAVFAGRS